MDKHPITPPPKLVDQWWGEVGEVGDAGFRIALHIATQAACWGADQELEACCEYLTRCAAWEPEDVQEMLDLRRPKPPSLKEQALHSIEVAVADGRFTADVYNLIRLALEKSIV